jgi:hypothetical protein
MYQYRIFSRGWSALQRAGVVLALILLFLLGMQFLRGVLILRRAPPVMAYGILGLFLLAALVIAAKIYAHRRDHRILSARGLAIGPHTSHADLKRRVSYHVHYLTRLSLHRLLTDEQSAVLRQQAHDLGETLHHHPLNDDLLRGIEQAREGFILPAFAQLDQIGGKVVQAKIQAALQDLYEPPFPIIPPLVVGYHLFTLLSEVTDIYIAQPSLREYQIVIRDVWEVMTKGDFLRYGQRLFSGIHGKQYKLGRAGEDFGHTMSITWLIYAIHAAARHRCTTLHDWKLSDAITHMKAGTPGILQLVRDSLSRDSLPILKRHIWHYAPHGQDPEHYAEDVSQSFVKSVDAVVLALTDGYARAVKTVPAPAANTTFPVNDASRSAGALLDNRASQPGDTPHRRRRRRRSKPSNLQILMRLFRRGRSRDES